MRSDAEIDRLYAEAVRHSPAGRRYAAALAAFNADDELISRQHVSSRWKTANILKVKLRILMTCEFIRQELGEQAVVQDVFLDIGASSHLFARTLGTTRYLGVNLLPGHAAGCRAGGLPAIVADATRLPLSDKSIDHLLSFECLEHVPEPGAMLHECARIARRSVFVSIPYRQQTRVLPPDNRDPFSQHVVEFSLPDLAAFASHFGLETVAATHFSFYEEPRWFTLRHW